MTVALLPAQMIGTSPVTLYTAPGVARVSAALLTNVTGEISAVSLHVARANASVVPVLTAIQLAGAQSHVATELMAVALGAGDAIVAMATMAASIQATLAVST